MAASITVHLKIFKRPQLPHFSTDFGETGIKIHGLLRSFILIVVIIKVAVPFIKKTWFECVRADMKMCSLGSINPLNIEAWGLGVRHSSHLLPIPVLGTPAAVEK